MRMEPNDTPGKNKWYRRLALLFLILFGVFWSLGPFFFWMLLGLSVYFGFLAFYSSGIKISLFNRPPQLAPQASLLENPSRSDQGRRDPSVPQGPSVVVRKVVRNLVIFFALLFVLFFVVGIFSDGDEAPTESKEVELSSPVENDEAIRWNDKGNASLDKGNYDSALIYYDKSLAAEPQYQYAMYNKGLLFSRRQEYRKSNSLIRKCLRLYPDYNPGWWVLGYNYDQLNYPDSALTCLETAYNNSFSNSDFLEFLGDLYLKKDRRAKAKDIYEKVIEQDTTKAAVYRRLAELDPKNADRYRKKASALGQSSK